MTRYHTIPYNRYPLVATLNRRAIEPYARASPRLLIVLRISTRKYLLAAIISTLTCASSASKSNATPQRTSHCISIGSAFSQAFIVIDGLPTDSHQPRGKERLSETLAYSYLPSGSHRSDPVACRVGFPFIGSFSLPRLIRETAQDSASASLVL